MKGKNMAKKHLIKKEKFKTSSGSGTKISKLLNVTEKNGNKHILRATVISVRKSESAALEEDTNEFLSINQGIIQPPLPLSELAVLSELSTELFQTIQAMEIGIDGFGGRLIQRRMTEEEKEKHKDAILKEKNFLDTLILYPNADDSFVSLRRQTRNELEHTGNAFWELVKASANATQFSCMNRIKSSNVWITKQDKLFTKKTVNFVKSDFTMGKKIFPKKFRKFVQIRNRKKVFFKEFGDPRIIDRRTGEEGKKSLARKHHATELFHFKIPTNRNTPYGMPRFVGNIITIKGSRQSDETNILTLMNNQVPSMAIMVNGGMLTKGSLDRIQDFIDTQIKGDSNYSKFLLLEGESMHDNFSSPSNLKIEIKALSRDQHTDQLWQEYDKNNANKLRRNFRVAPILVGDSESIDRAVAQESERITEKYVYNPEREEEDVIINKIFLSQGIRFWEFKSNSPNVTNDQDIVKILSGAEKSGALTPRIARMLLEDVLNSKLPDIDANIPEGFDPDVPFSFTLAKLMHEAGMANQNGTFESQGQTPKAPRSSENTDKNTDFVSLIHKLIENPSETLDVFKKIERFFNIDFYQNDDSDDVVDYDEIQKAAGNFIKKLNKHPKMTKSKKKKKNKKVNTK